MLKSCVNLSDFLGFMSFCWWDYSLIAKYGKKPFLHSIFTTFFAGINCSPLAIGLCICFCPFHFIYICIYICMWCVCVWERERFPFFLEGWQARQSKESSTRPSTFFSPFFWLYMDLDIIIWSMLLLFLSYIWKFDWLLQYYTHIYWISGIGCLLSVINISKSGAINHSFNMENQMCRNRSTFKIELRLPKLIWPPPCHLAIC